MISKSKYCLILDNRGEQLAITMSNNDVKAMEQIMNGILFNFPSKVSFCFDAIEKIKSLYVENNERLSGSELVDSILKNMPEINIKMFEFGEASIINSSFDYDKKFTSFEDKQTYVDHFIKREQKVIFDGVYIKYNIQLIQHIIDVVNMQVKKRKIDTADNFINRKLLQILDLKHLDIFTQVEECFKNAWNIKSYDEL